MPALSYRAAPPLVAGGLLLAALALLALPARLGRRWWRDRRPVDAEEAQVELAPLERALLIVEWANERDAEDRRSALGALAVELDESGEEDLGRRARELAWARAEPSGESAWALVKRVREERAAPA